MYPRFRSLLFKLDPETAHALTLQALRLAGAIRPLSWALARYFAAPAKAVQAFGLTFKNPVGLAAGYDKDGVAIRGLAALGFGHVEIGTVTPPPQPGNPAPRVFRLVEDQGLINRLGFPSRGTEYVQLQLNPSLKIGLVERALGFSVPRPQPMRYPLNTLLGVNLGKNKHTPNEQAVFDYLSLLQNFAPLADYLVINISSPNTAGLRRLQERAALESLLKQLHAQRSLEEKRWEKRVPLLVKLSPDLTAAELDDAVEVILGTGMDGIVATNTTVSRAGLRSPLGAESGGLSGKPLSALSDAVLAQIVARVNGQIPVIGVGGILHPEDVRRKLDLGATLVQLYSGLVYAGPGLVKTLVTKL